MSITMSYAAISQGHCDNYIVIEDLFDLQCLVESLIRAEKRFKKNDI